MTKKIMVAMSGGVDSSVAALLLQKEGYEIVGATLRLFANEDIGLDADNRTCCSLQDVEDARSVSHKLGVDHFVLNYRTHFQREVIERFIDGYLRGETPNPCIDCNRFIKFDRLLQQARLLGADKIATGHYARIDKDEAGDRYLLKKGKDESKDQSYVLYAMTQTQLAGTLLPLGGLDKDAVRDIAEKSGLINARKADSQDICFVRDGRYADFIEQAIGRASEPGDFITADGRILGRHNGLIRYTVGQRKGLGISADQPLYVLRKEPDTNHVVLGVYDELFEPVLYAREFNWISMEPTDVPVSVTVRTRYHQSEVPAVLYRLPDDKVKIAFDRPQRANAPGQAVVCYQNDVVVGGGTIQAVK